MSCPANRVPAINQYRTLGFHLMNVSFCATMVAPPKSTITPRLTHCIGSTLPVLWRSQAICAMVATMATAVAT